LKRIAFVLARPQRLRAKAGHPSDTSDPACQNLSGWTAFVQPLMRKSGRMKNQNRIQNAINENQNQAIIFEPIAPNPEPAAIGELLTLNEIEDAIKGRVVLSDAVVTALVACKGDLS
jgi:hypothetical protein